jgi:hypothetical protein
VCEHYQFRHFRQDIKIMKSKDSLRKTDTESGKEQGGGLRFCLFEFSN